MPRPQLYLDLLTREPPASPPRPGSRSVARKPQLWIAVCLPKLPIESLPEHATAEPAAVVEPQQGQIRVVAVNARAQRCGIEPGHKLGAARALATSLRVYERLPSFERACLESLASSLQSLTPTVSLAPPDSLLLEASGSLKLFHSLAAIKARIEAGLAQRRLTARLSAAPTALASLWLARAAAADVAALDELAGRLSELPLTVTHWPEPVQKLLHDLGLRSLGDCLRLPRDGFARRVGKSYLEELDLALGRRFELRPEFTAPTRWKLALDLQEESSDCAVLMEALELLIDRLTAELRRSQAQVRSLRVVLEHLRRPPTLEDFTLLSPTHERERFLSVLRDRVERIVLPAPVIALTMRTGPFEALSSTALGLFEKTQVETAACTLFERLRGRFGFESVHGMSLIPEHRPERAWTKIDCAAAVRRGPQRPVPRARPLWLLSQPVPLESPDARRYYLGSLHLQSGPERIESGWWDGQDVSRDYYVARSDDGQRLWIYRDRKSRAWHLHGLFG